jgi:hypothetical protein
MDNILGKSMSHYFIALEKMIFLQIGEGGPVLRSGFYFMGNEL